MVGARVVWHVVVFGAPWRWKSLAIGTLWGGLGVAASRSGGTAVQIHRGREKDEKGFWGDRGCDSLLFLGMPLPFWEHPTYK